MSETIGGLLILAGTLLLAIACLGVLRLPDALSRQHAATRRRRWRWASWRSAWPCCKGAPRGGGAARC